jgi:RNA polymerase sigma-70 factor (ECF subfamily)
LQAESVADGKAKLFDQLKRFLMAGPADPAYREVAAALGLEETAVRVAVHRLRKRYRQLLRDEIANTLADPAMVDEEMRALFGAFS